MEFGRRVRSAGGGGMMMMEIAVVLGMLISVGVCQDPSPPPTLHKVGVFRFDKRYYNVLEVNETSYNYCNDQSFITNITRGGRDVFQLTEARTYYFLSSGGYCFHGMKLTINVTRYYAAAAAVNATSTPHSSSSSSSSEQPLLLLLLLFLLIILV
ncbi:uncharacterized protein LOC124939615 [Impatiens glandulifera]|uniref:uncharacterized protein LOC124939615 n=1 Tax=Impatiens glandulifera TaxID=253017 RepID=UPI001FB13DE1|nr:uncharacterized protein LOC124939615 [Impatiens glandulifera]